MTALLLPSLILLALLNIYPLVYAISQSLHDGNLVQTGPFVGLDNFTAVLEDDRFWAATRVTGIFAVAGVLGSWLVGLALALTFKAGLPFRALLRGLLLLPWVIPVVVSAATWQWLVSTPSSPVRVLTRALGAGDVLFLADPKWAIITLCVFRIWVSYPFMFLQAGAALEAIDNDLYEAATVDGASRIQRFTHITWPLIRKSTLISLLLMTIFTVNDFGSVYLLTGGGPAEATQTLPVLSYLLVFREFTSGTGVAVSVLMSVALVLLSIILYRQIRKSE